MSYCGHKPGMCGKQPDCADVHCPGRWESVAPPREWWETPAVFFVVFVLVACAAGGADTLLSYLQVTP